MNIYLERISGQLTIKFTEKHKKIHILVIIFINLAIRVKCNCHTKESIYSTSRVSQIPRYTC